MVICRTLCLPPLVRSWTRPDRTRWDCTRRRAASVCLQRPPIAISPARRTSRFDRGGRFQGACRRDRRREERTRFANRTKSRLCRIRAQKARSVPADVRSDIGRAGKISQLEEAAEVALDVLRHSIAVGDEFAYEQDTTAMAGWGLIHGLSSLLIDGLVPAASARSLAEGILGRAVTSRLAHLPAEELPPCSPRATAGPATVSRRQHLIGASPR